MPNIKIGDNELHVDVRAELEEFEWVRPRWTHDKLIAASPFRYDKSPSFFVRLYEHDKFPAGTWSDSGAYDDDWKSGNFIKLLSFLRNDTLEETRYYLLQKYGISTIDSKYEINFPYLHKNVIHRKLNSSIIDLSVSPYISSRKVSEEVQIQAGIGKSQYKGFVAIPWLAPDGQLANVKYRSTRGKTFFYESNARPISELVYGANLYSKSSDNLIVCEAEIDALSWRTVGINAVALGGVTFTQRQAEILCRLPFDKLIVAGDNDKAGMKFNARIVQALKNKRALAVLQWGDTERKDANEILCKDGRQALRELVKGALDLPTISCTL